MFKSLLFLSVIVSLAYSAPYGSSNLGGGVVVDHGIGLGVGVGLGGVTHHGITERVVPLGSSHVAVSTVDHVVGVGAPVIQQRVLGSIGLGDSSYGSSHEVVTQAPTFVTEAASYGSSHEVVTQAPTFVTEAASYGSSHEVVTQAPLIVQEVVTQAASYGSQEVVTQAPVLVTQAASYGSRHEEVQAPAIVHEALPVVAHSSY